MTRFTKLFALVSLLSTASAASIAQRNDLVVRAGNSLINPGPDSVPLPPKGPDPSTTNPTDNDTIFSTAQQVDQKTGPTDSAPPSDSVPPTIVTAVDGDVTAAGQSGDALLDVLHNPDSQPDLNTGSSVSKRDVSLKKRDTYTEVFSGTGTASADRDASIQGTAYLTFTRLDSYDVGACKTFCDGIEACVFVNIFYEYNTDATYNPQIKCAAYGDVHTAAEKTNAGGQQLLPPPAGVSYIQESEGYAADSLVEPPVPDGYKFVFGPTNGANQSPGYMGFAFLDKYDVQACANLCNTRGPDGNGGACQYFNIWRAVVNGNPTTYTCAMYYIPTTASTATNTGQGNLQVTFSRGYSRITLVLDGGFEGFIPTQKYIYYTESYTYWIGTSPPGGEDDALIFDDTLYAHTGHGSACLGSSFGSDPLPGTITPAAPLNTVSGKTYLLTFFQWSARYIPDEGNAFVDVYWNGDVVYQVKGSEPYTYHQVQVTAAGNDVLAFTGGSYPSYDFLDDIYLFLA